MGKPTGSLRLLIPGATLFFLSGCIMVLGLVATRLTARALGSSLYTWTSVIVVMLAGLAFGSMVGGRIADRFHVRRALSVLLALSSAACVGLVIVDNAASGWLWLWRLSWPVHVFIHVSLVFLPASTLLGAAVPVVLKMSLDQGLTPGRAIGTVFAWAAAGAVAGALLVGFFLIPSFGSTAIIWGLGAALLAVAVLYWISCWVLYLWSMIFVTLGAMGMAPADWARDAGIAAGLREVNDPSIVYETETVYAHISVRRISDEPDKRALWQDQRRGGELVLSNITDLQSFHTEVCAGLVRGMDSDRPLSVMVTGSGYLLARYLREVRPDSRMEVVEVDPGLTAATLEGLALPRDAAIRTVGMDLRPYVNQLARDAGSDLLREPYDLIYFDAVGDYSVPFQQMTLQFNDKIAALLSDEGLYVVSLVDALGSGRFLGAVVGTLEQTFPHVWVIGRGGVSSGLSDTYVVVASRRALDPESILTEHNEYLVFSVLDESEIMHLKDRCGNMVLTDDYAPVRDLLRPAARSGVRPQLAQRLWREATRLQSQRRYEPSIATYQRAAEQDPSIAMQAYSAIGAMQLELGDLERAAEALERAIAGHMETGLQQADLALVHLNLGVLLQRVGRPTRGRVHLAEAAKYFRIDLRRNPKSASTWERLGDTLIVAGDLREATDAFEKALSLDPENLDCYDKLSRILEVQQRYDEAIAVVQRQIDVLRAAGRRDAVREMTEYVSFLRYQKVRK